MGSGRSWERDSTMKGDKRGSSLRVLPLIPLGISKPKPATYFKKKEKEKKKHLRKVTDNYKKTPTQNPNRFPSSCPPPPK